jgi:hypothetical protein
MLPGTCCSHDKATVTAQWIDIGSTELGKPNSAAAAGLIFRYGSEDRKTCAF